MIERVVVIPNKLGLHARSASKLVSVSASFVCDISITYQEKQVNGKSIMELLMLAAKQGESLTITCDGHQEEEACNALIELISQGFGE